MTADDLDDVHRIERRSFTNPWPRSSFEGEIDNEPMSESLVIIHSPDDRIIGYIIIWMMKDVVQISNIAVDPEYRRRGVGEQVMLRIIRRKRREGFRRVFLEVRPSNTTAVKLYEKLGFVVVGKRPHYYHKPKEDALIMLKMITGSGR